MYIFPQMSNQVKVHVKTVHQDIVAYKHIYLILVVQALCALLETLVLPPTKSSMPPAAVIFRS